METQTRLSRHNEFISAEISNWPIYIYVCVCVCVCGLRIKKMKFGWPEFSGFF